MFKSRRGNQAVGGAERCSLQLALTVQNAPAISDGVGDWQDAALKPDQHVSVKPRLQIRTTAAAGEYNKPLAELTDGDSAEKKGRLLLIL